MKTADLIVHGGWVIPIEPPDAVWAQHTVIVCNGRIEAIMPQSEVAAHYRSDSVRDLSGHALMPGLVNAHTHAAMNLFRGIADDLPLITWLQQHIWPAEAKWLSPDFVRDGTLLAIAEMLLSGTTCFQDMYLFPNTASDAAREAGIRAVIGLILIDFPTAWAATTDEYFSKGLEIHDRLGSDYLLTTAFAPHAPYTVSDSSMERMRILAEELDLPIHIHLHESVETVATSVDKYGMRPLQRLHKLHILNPNLCAVHMTQLLPAEIELLAEYNANVVHCPESNLKLASGLCPVKKLLDAGINVAIGTDGAASNNDLDMFGEIRTAALVAKIAAADPSAFTATQVLQSATLGGAKALGLAHEIGSLAIGKSADLIAVDLNTLQTQPLFNPISQLVFSAGREHVTDVWIAGREIVRDRELQTLDAAALLSNAAQWHARIAAA